MLPVLFTIGPFNVYAFGFFLAISFLLSTFLVWKYAKEALKEEEYLDIFLYTSFATLLAARLVYILFHFEEFGLNILRYIVVREAPGLSLLGGLLGGLIFLTFYLKKKKEPLLSLLDLFSLSYSLALVFAKIGESLGGGGFGRETNFFLGIKIIGLLGRRHPVELYEAAIFFFLFLILFTLFQKVRRAKWPEGLVFFLFSQGVAASIFFFEFLKDYKQFFFGLTLGQLAALIVLLVTFYPLAKRIRVVKMLGKEKRI